MELKPINPDYHQAPTPGQLAGIRPGSCVRLQLNSGSRFWARIMEPRRPDGIYRAAALDNIDPVKIGDMVFCERRHIYEVI